jgi:hypothetical protein
MRLHNQIRLEAVAIAAPDYALFHCSLGFEAIVNIAEQYNKQGGHVLGAGLIDIYNTACCMAEEAGEVAACTVQPKLLSEQ